MRSTRALGALLCAGMLWLSLGAPGMADARYTMEMTMQNGEHQVKITTTTEIKGQRERMDQSMDYGPVKVQRTTLTMCDRHEIAEICAPAKVYTVGPLDPMTRLAQAHQPLRGHETGTGHVILTISITDRGPERIGRWDTRHYAVNTRIQSSGCAGDGDHTLHYDIWVAPGHLVGLVCPEMMKPSIEVDNGGCKITYENRGDMDKLEQINRALVVQRIMRNPQGGSMTQRLVDFSEAPLSQSDFQIPASFTKVSRPEFEQKVMQQMMPQGLPPRPQP